MPFAGPSSNILQTQKILIVQELSSSEKVFGKKILKKRYELITEVVDRASLSIKISKLYQEEVDKYKYLGRMLTSEAEVSMEIDIELQQDGRVLGSTNIF